MLSDDEMLCMVDLLRSEMMGGVNFGQEAPLIGILIDEDNYVRFIFGSSPHKLRTATKNINGDWGKEVMSIGTWPKTGKGFPYRLAGQKISVDEHPEMFESMNMMLQMMEV